MGSLLFRRGGGGVCEKEEGWFWSLPEIPKGRTFSLNYLRLYGVQKEGGRGGKGIRFGEGACLPSFPHHGCTHVLDPLSAVFPHHHRRRRRPLFWWPVVLTFEERLRKRRLLRSLGLPPRPPPPPRPNLVVSPPPLPPSLFFSHPPGTFEG